LAFCNVKAHSQDEVANFCNGYQVNPTWVIDGKKTITAGFAEIQNKYAPIIKKVLTKDALTYSDVLTINKGLKHTSFHLTPRKGTEETIEFERKFELIIPVNQEAKIGTVN
jgi:hypothetical protein